MLKYYCSGTTCGNKVGHPPLLEQSKAEQKMLVITNEEDKTISYVTWSLHVIYFKSF